MINQKLIAVSTFQIFITAFLLSYFHIEVHISRPKFLNKFYSFFPKEAATASHAAQDSNSISSKPRDTKKSAQHGRNAQILDEKTLRLFTSKQLSNYDGSSGAPGLYLGLLGRVYDVGKGSKHYGPGGGYHFFAGRDATKAFVTGDFSEPGLIDDVYGLSPQDLIGIQEWVQFYEKEYKLVGHVAGTYYDFHGNPTTKLTEAEKLFQSARDWQISQKADLERFPSCNSEWTQGKGGRVWCSNKSGGITRDWVGVPRKLFTPGSGQSRCACVNDSGPSQDSQETDNSSNNRGDLDNPNLRLYDNCNPKAVSCNIS